MAKFSSLFQPRSVAIVGVSEDPVKLGSVILSNLREAGYQGKIFPVNPKHQQLFGLKTYKSVKAIQAEVDLVCIAVPAQFVKDVIKDCVAKQVQAAIIISAGFREIGAEGIALEAEILQIAKRGDLRLLGPNCLGLSVPGSNLNVSFAAAQPNPGDIAFISQSGAFCTAMLDLALEKNLGFSHFISLGNKVDIAENELLADFLVDPKVKVVGAYLEEINYGHELVKQLKAGKEAGKVRKPLLVFKPGISHEAKQTISSHTGSLAGSVEAYQTAMAQAGVIEAHEINQMFYLMMGFAWAPLPKGKRVAVVTNAGGPGIIATDEIIKHGLEMAKLSDETKAALKASLPATASIHNPVDVIGDALAERYRLPLDILLQDENVDAVILLLTPQLVTQIEDTAKLIINTAKLANKPVLAVFIGGRYILSGLQRLYDKKVPAFRYVKDAVSVLAAMYEYQQTLQAKPANLQPLISKELGKGKYRAELNKLLKQAGTAVTLPEELVTKLAQEVGLNLPQQAVVSSLAQAAQFAKHNYPVVLKATNALIAHKTDVKALYLNLNNEAELAAAYEELVATIAKFSKLKRVKVLVQEQIKAKEELFIGCNRDGGSDLYQAGAKGFGHLLAFGKGGIYTEVYKDIAYGLVPVTQAELAKAFAQTKVAKIVEGARGQAPLALAKYLNQILAVQKLVLRYPEIVSLDINPLLLTENKAVAVDIKIFAQT